MRVPGYFAADGNAAESSATSGNKWRVKFTPNEADVWTYSVSFLEGPQIAVPADSSPTAGKSAGAPDGENGSFTVQPADPDAPGFYGKGMLVYVGEHYLQFQGSKQWFVKAGPGSPEDFFGYRQKLVEAILKAFGILFTNDILNEDPTGVVSESFGPS